jgi:hypothetical protein
MEGERPLGLISADTKRAQSVSSRLLRLCALPAFVALDDRADINQSSFDSASHRLCNRRAKSPPSTAGGTVTSRRCAPANPETRAEPSVPLEQRC